MTPTKEQLHAELDALKKRLAKTESVLSSCEDDSIRQRDGQRLFASGPVVLFKWARQDNWPVEYVSENVEHIFGYTERDFLESKIQYEELVHPDDKKRVMSEMKQCIRNGTDRFTHEPYRITRKDGEQIWLLDHTVIVRDDAEDLTHFVGYVIDVTDQVKTQNRLVESEERWNFALEGSRDGVWDWDASTNKVFFSDQWKRMLGFEPEEISDDLSEWESRVHPDDKDAVFKDLVPHLEGRTEFYENTHRVLCKDGSYKWILDRGKVITRDADGKPLRIIGTHTDLTEYKEVQHELQKAHKHISDILENTTDAFFELDEEFCFSYVNKRAEKSLGISRHDVLGHNIWEVFPQAVGTIFHDKYTEAAKTQRVVEFEAYFQPFDVWFQVHAYPTQETLSVHFKDITSKKRLELEREKIFNLSTDMICIAGFDGKLKKVNPAWEKTLGWTESDLTSTPWIDFVHPDDIAETLEAGKELLKGDTITQFQNRYQCKDGSYRWLSWNSVPQLEEKLIFCVVRDITDQKRIEHELEVLATTDPLTEQLNRRSFMEKATKEWERFLRYDRPCSTLMLDLDHFKRVNDTYGHKAGDNVLKKLAETVSSMLREVDSLGRIGGEEFAVLLPETDMEDAAQAAERIRHAVEETEIRHGEESIRITISIGVASTRKGDKEYDDALRRADEALYRAKDAGRNQVQRS
ncbi:GGDEF domain-containing protein [Salidesulfovibrio brasiliensis]|uniref:GGDEF domain-containing protein n=1 Tax=Salidesulfovibrio brasiliensis TaxID=221711 RepID=UPI0006D0CE75|nr:sensor domain-containing diguanylate cyclase [Salidesulfovibrio brasiliensis]